MEKGRRLELRRHSPELRICGEKCANRRRASRKLGKVQKVQQDEMTIADLRPPAASGQCVCVCVDVAQKGHRGASLGRILEQEEAAFELLDRDRER